MTDERRPAKVRTTISGIPNAFDLEGRTWVVVAEPTRWYERISWWETERRMSLRDGGTRIDVEVWQLQARDVKATGGPMTTFELVRARDGWYIRSQSEDR